MSFERLDYDGDMLSRALLSGINDPRVPKVKIWVGVGAYENSVRLLWRDGSSTEYRPFFFGRPGKRNISHQSIEQQINHREVIEQNSFSKMLACTLGDWMATQDNRFEQMTAVIRALEKLETARLQG